LGLPDARKAQDALTSRDGLGRNPHVGWGGTHPSGGSERVRRCEAMPTMPASAGRADAPSLIPPLLAWFTRSARDLPWRGRGALGWPVLVSEVMLQQTPVVRVLPVFEAWMARWPEPATLAADSPGEAVRMWGRLGYPRRALRLHAAATVCVERYGGSVPSGLEQLRGLPGVGAYTAAAVASFAYGGRHAVLDTNVRRVLARLVGGRQYEPAGAPTAAERAAAEALLPDDPTVCAGWNAALMELGALVCTARGPDCASCPVATSCRWRLAGYPAWAGPARRGQTYEGTDRQARGRLLAALRDADSEVGADALQAVWPDDQQRERALDSLVADGLVEPLEEARYRLPG
jgi:A/G-specific adenine glycosylase